VTVKKQVEFK